MERNRVALSRQVIRNDIVQQSLENRDRKSIGVTSGQRTGRQLGREVTLEQIQITLVESPN